MATSPVCVIHNPGAGQGSIDSVREVVGSDGEIRRTEGPGHAIELARRAVEEGFSTVVAAGGDGTLGEVVNGLMAADRDAVCGLLPVGTGNDFARSMDIPDDLAEAWRVVRAGRAVPIDLVAVTVESETTWLVNVAVGAKIEEARERLTSETKSRWGPLAYLRTSAATLWDLEPYSLRLAFDDEPLPLDAHAVVVANGRWVAGGMPIAPRALVDDGWLDCIVIRAVEGLDIATLGAKVFAAAHLEPEVDERVEFRRCRRIEIDSVPPLPFHADGESLGTTPIRFELMPGALRMNCGSDPVAMTASAPR